MDQEKITIAKKQDDAQIWESFLKGSEKSFKQLHQQYYNDLYAYALKISRDEYIAKNAIQELFVYLWKNKASLNKAKHVRHYLIFSLRRHVIRLLKKEQKHLHLSINNEDEAFPVTFSPADILITRETTLINEKYVIDALNQLPPRQREIIYLRYFQDLSMEEIAQILSVNYQSVLNALSRGIKNLRKLLLSQKSLEIFLFIFIPAVFLFLF